MTTIYGVIVDDQTRCKHYHTTKDIIAIKFNCCQKYYPCYQCHEACEDHPISVWGKDEFDELAIICGVCKTEHTINQYMNTNKCLHCESPFNEGCQKHYHLYFDYTPECKR
ncbi:CHY zinc finger protein [Oceanobacillus jeddahense]|uniref:CHY zinc finger protein n=2 Tax=Oceanobacillus jeddahense TaxID=1462527 RepID=A0ABY5JU31_9BACI|nr:CHY zinc finger protein [Oceanobacillus jeddahense]UUI02678.1 CHY zinc finger protein [Oceanobacillus jeddahense]